MDLKQFEVICKKLDKMTVILAIQNIEDRDKKIYALKQAELTSKEIGDFIGLAESSVRESKGWGRKCLKN